MPPKRNKWQQAAYDAAKAAASAPVAAPAPEPVAEEAYVVPRKSVARKGPWPSVGRDDYSDVLTRALNPARIAPMSPEQQMESQRYTGTLSPTAKRLPEFPAVPEAPRTQASVLEAGATRRATMSPSAREVTVPKTIAEPQDALETVGKTVKDAMDYVLARGDRPDLVVEQSRIPASWDRTKQAAVVEANRVVASLPALAINAGLAAKEGIYDQKWGRAKGLGEGLVKAIPDAVTNTAYKTALPLIGAVTNDPDLKSLGNAWANAPVTSLLDAQVPFAMVGGVQTGSNAARLVKEAKDASLSVPRRALAALSVPAGVVGDFGLPGGVLSPAEAPVKALGAAVKVAGNLPGKAGPWVRRNLWSKSAQEVANAKAIGGMGDAVMQRQALAEKLWAEAQRDAVHTMPPLKAQQWLEERGFSGDDAKILAERMGVEKEAKRDFAGAAREVAREERFASRVSDLETRRLAKEAEALTAAGVAEGNARGLPDLRESKELLNQALRVEKNGIPRLEPTEQIGLQAQALVREQRRAGPIEAIPGEAMETPPGAFPAQKYRISDTPTVVGKGKAKVVKYGDAPEEDLARIVENPESVRHQVVDNATGKVLFETPEFRMGKVETAADAAALDAYADFIAQHADDILKDRISVDVPIVPPADVHPAAWYKAEIDQGRAMTDMAKWIAQTKPSREVLRASLKRMTHLAEYDAKHGIPSWEDILREVRQKPMESMGRAEMLTRPDVLRSEKQAAGGYVRGEGHYQKRLDAWRQQMAADRGRLMGAEDAAKQYRAYAKEVVGETDRLVAQSAEAEARYRQKMQDAADYWEEKAAAVRAEQAAAQARGESRLAASKTATADAVEANRVADQYMHTAANLRKLASAKVLPKGTYRAVDLRGVAPDDRAIVLKAIDGDAGAEPWKTPATKNLLPAEMATDLEARFAKERPIGWKALLGDTKLGRAVDAYHKLFVTQQLYSVMTPWLPVQISNEISNFTLALGATLEHRLYRLMKHVNDATMDYRPRWVNGKLQVQPDMEQMVAGLPRREWWQLLGGDTGGGSEYVPTGLLAPTEGEGLLKRGAKGAANAVIKGSNKMRDMYGGGWMSDLKWKEGFVRAYLEKHPNTPPQVVADLAKKHFLDYGNLPHASRLMSSTLTPFINWSVAATPAIARIMNEYGWTLNALMTIRDYAEARAAEQDGFDIKAWEAALPAYLQGQEVYYAPNQGIRPTRGSVMTFPLEAARQHLTQPLLKEGVTGLYQDFGSIQTPLLNVAQILLSGNDPKTKRPVYTPLDSDAAAAGKIALAVLRPVLAPSAITRFIEQVPAMFGEEVPASSRGGIVRPEAPLLNLLAGLGPEELDDGLLRDAGATKFGYLDNQIDAVWNASKKKYANDPEELDKVREAYIEAKNALVRRFQLQNPDAPLYIRRGSRR